MTIRSMLNGTLPALLLMHAANYLDNRSHNAQLGHGCSQCC